MNPPVGAQVRPQLGARLVIGGTHSGVGKTTVATGLMAALRRRAVAVAGAKVGPDFIDPGYHALATGRPPRNLDPWICGVDAMVPLAARAAAGAELLVIEGVMGLFDGAVDNSPSSTADVARILAAPVVLVVDASAMSGSVAALVRGYRDHDPSITVAGVILNRVGSDQHSELLTEALAAIDVTVFGALGRNDAFGWRDRHLGLIPVAERPEQVAESLDRLADAIAAACDLDGLVALARRAPTLRAEPVRRASFVGDVRIAIASGPAFTFLYEDNLEALQDAGAELVRFDPLVDASLPPGCDGLLIGGGFPEVYATRLGHNRALLAAAQRAVADGLVVWAECGGLLWLCASLDDVAMADALAAVASMTDRLHLGYRTALASAANPVVARGAEVRGHEFHYSTVEPGGRPGGEAFQLTSRFGSRPEGWCTPTMLATYLHLHLGGDPTPAENFVRACVSSRRDR